MTSHAAYVYILSQLTFLLAFLQQGQILALHIYTYLSMHRKKKSSNARAKLVGRLNLDPHIIPGTAHHSLLLQTCHLYIRWDQGEPVTALRFICCHNQSEHYLRARDQTCLSEHSCLYILDVSFVHSTRCQTFHLHAYFCHMHAYFCRSAPVAKIVSPSRGPSRITN